MTRMDQAVLEIAALRQTLMECSHVLNHTSNKGRVNDRLKAKIRRHLEQKRLTSTPRRQILPH